MRILTVSQSPYNLTSTGKINSILLSSLYKDHEISSVVWDHNTSYYLPQEDNLYYYDSITDKKIEIVPISLQDNNKTQILFEHMKKFNPNIVVSIGDYFEINFISEIKKLYPNLFKWLGILTIYSLPINNDFIDSLSYLDEAILVNELSYNDFKNKFKLPNSCIKLGVEGQNITEPITNHLKMKIVASSKNTQQSNIAAFISSVGKLGQNHDIEAYLHTNVNNGDYDLIALKKEYDKNNVIKLPNEFVSFYDGIDHKEFINRLKNSDIIVDCSMSSCTGISVLEGMSVGCIPVCNSTNALLPIILSFDPKLRFLIKDYKFIGPKEGILKIVDENDIYTNLKILYNIWETNKKEFYRIKENSIKITETYKMENFIYNPRYQSHRWFHHDNSAIFY